MRDEGLGHRNRRGKDEQVQQGPFRVARPHDAHSDRAGHEPLPRPNGNGGGKGKVVCAGDTVTTNGQGGDAGVASGTFPIGTLLKITNLDNNQSITVPVMFAAMGAHYFIRDNERHYDLAKSKDKDFVVIEGAVHGFTPCTACTGPVPGVNLRRCATMWPKRVLTSTRVRMR